MIASYRLQLHPEFTFDDVRAQLSYIKKLGISHLYLSPVTEAVDGSTHGYDVTDHNRVREAFGGREGFDRLLEDARAHDLGLILDFVPNHAGVGSDNVYWQDVLAYGPHSAYAHFFDIDWKPVKRELRQKVLLPFLGSPYGEALENGELGLCYRDGSLYASYYDNLFALTPASYLPMLEAALPQLERTDLYFDLKDLIEGYRTLEPSNRSQAEGLKVRLQTFGDKLDWTAAFADFKGERLHGLLEEQFWRLAYWKTAGHEINYRRFFDINGLVGLRMENPDVFWDAHRLLGELLVQEGVHGVRIDHVDGLFDPHAYLRNLKTLGARNVWVEKILAPGETLPESWPVCGTSGYIFMNDAMRVLVYGGAQEALLRLYRQSVEGQLDYEQEVHNAKKLVMQTGLSGELFRLARQLDRLSEGDYRTRDFTSAALREALREIVASFPRYRTYLPYEPEEAEKVIHETVRRAKHRNPAAEQSVYDFVERVLLGTLDDGLQDEQQDFIGRFQQYCAPVAAKGVEDTTFYRYMPLVALNEVGGEPETFALEPQAFHSHARFRAYRYPTNLLATATHDHKRGEDTRMRLIVLAELPEAWREVVTALGAEAQRYRRSFSGMGLPRIPAAEDEYLFYQLLVALWDSGDLEERLVAYMQKAVREAKHYSSWLSPNSEYESGLEAFVRNMMESEPVAQIVKPFARDLACYGFYNSLAQLLLKVSTPGVPDFYQGVEFLDLSLVDPDNRRPVDYAERAEKLEAMEGLLAAPDTTTLRDWLESQDPQLKLYITAQTLRFRGQHPALFRGGYRALEPTGDAADFYLAYGRECDDERLLVVVPRFPARWEKQEAKAAHIPLPDGYSGRSYRDVLTGETWEGGERLELNSAAFPFRMLYSEN